MDRRALIVGVLLAGVLVTTLWGQRSAPRNGSRQPSGEAAEPSVLAQLHDVRWTGASVSPEMLKGKTVLVLIYASWCPKCNEWSGEFFALLKSLFADQPAVILAVGADKTPAESRAYVRRHDFLAPNIIHGYHPELHTRLGFRSTLFQCVLIAPDGSEVFRGYGGVRIMLAEGGMEYEIERMLREIETPGELQVITDDMSPELRNVLWSLEVGSASEAQLRKAREQLDAAQQKQLNAAVLRYMDLRLAEAKRLATGDVLEQMTAYANAKQLARIFTTTQQSKLAAKYVEFKNNDAQFRRELAARTAYEGLMGNTKLEAERRDELLRSLGKRYAGTYYGELAAEASAPQAAANARKQPVGKH